MITILDSLTINQIAAGEVVDRPASIVKELVENSMDAKATSISVEIKNGGIDFIKVTDNGEGFLPEEMELAFVKHSTSKIKTAKDLETVVSMGFRGEALASINSVSKVELISKNIKNQIGQLINISAGIVTLSKPIAATTGTTFIIKDLFFNIPARKLFLKSSGVEAAQITDIIYKLALSHPNIAFKYVKDSKLIFQTRGNSDIQEVIFNIYGKEIAMGTIPLNYELNNAMLYGRIGKMTLAKSSRNMELFFINGRYIQNKILNYALEEAYRTLIMSKKFPVAILYIQVPPTEININVHPAKLEVRFKDDEAIQNLIIDAVKNTFIENSLMPQFKDYNRSKSKEARIDPKIANSIDSAINLKANPINKHTNQQTKLIESNIADKQDEIKFKDLFKQSKNKIDPNKINLNKIDSNKIDPDRIDSNKIDSDKIDSNKIDPNKIYSNKIEPDNIKPNNVELKETVNEYNYNKDKPSVYSTVMAGYSKLFDYASEPSVALYNANYNLEHKQLKDTDVGQNNVKSLYNVEELSNRAYLLKNSNTLLSTKSLSNTDKLILDKVMANNDQLTKNKVTAMSDKLAENKMMATNDKLAENKVTATNDKLAENKVTATNDKLAENKMMATNDKLAENKMTATNGKLAENKVTATNDKLAENKVTATNDKLAKNKVTATNDKLAENKVTATNDKLAEEKTAPIEGLDYFILGQLFETYWMIKYGDTVLLMDQHAAHERIMYEKLLSEFTEDTISSQQLLYPITFKPSPLKFSIILEKISILTQLGFALDTSSGLDIVVNGVPFIFNKAMTAKEAINFLDDLTRSKRMSFIKEEKIISMACKAAIKGNNKISKIESKELIKDLLRLENPYSCPHGRPTLISLEKSDIEKLFKRIV
ncbi:MAG: hypothetical protein ATN31_08070 [Candidatus Epulonipiscioides saccharophilum]|nr:MAG: hypothetical protein ATN31_08070 [Epulopiscium sp. AS2M-Bin001]